MALQNVIPSYLYVQYNDDEAIMAFVQAFNEFAQTYLDYINALDLPIYTKEPVSDGLLDWVAAGLYGFQRPILPTVSVPARGPLNSFGFNVLPVNGYAPGGSDGTPYFTTDDVFRRVITWHFFKGDGCVFNIRWLKRRIMRFLFGADGINFNVDQTYRISVNLGPDGEVNILVVNSVRTITGGMVFNAGIMNQFPINGEQSTTITYDEIPEASILEQAMQSGILELPFQFTFTVTQGGLATFSI